MGGVAATCLYDNMKVVVSRHDEADEPVYNPRFLAFAAHYGFRPIACRVRRPQTKGKVERHFAYVESNFLGGRTFRDLEHLNERAAWWLAEVADVRVHQTTKARPIDRHAEDLPHLIALPARPFDAAEVVYRTVDAEAFVVYRQNFYAAPWRLIGQMVAVRVTDQELVIHDRDFVEAARHPLFARGTAGQRSVCPGHEPPRDAQKRAEQLAQRYGEYGPAGARFLEGLLAGSRFGKNQAERVLALAAVYPRGDVVAALERAVKYGAFSLQAVARILAAHGRPKTPLDALAEDHKAYLDRLLEGEPTPPRPTADYQALLGEEADDGETTRREDQAGPEAPPRGGEEGGGAESA
jgi:hypothetical protein